ncbi:MAG: HPr family phosphocarrier protein [Alphaproteobacteria bacterium]|nr:HPr family phosphocarrier protein [Alphaproteobacteria bacterium]MDE2336065.1 HPr family phosphocarrier protein [Alphaproteobacteria bacterium]
MTSALEKTVQIRNLRGLHARAAAKFVKIVECRKADVTVAKDDMSVRGASIMGLLMLSASKGTHIRIAVSGDDAASVLDELVSLVERRFDEE